MSEVNNNAANVNTWFDAYYGALDKKASGELTADQFNTILDGFNQQASEKLTAESGWGLDSADRAKYVSDFSRAETFADGTMEAKEVDQIVLEENNTVYALDTADANDDGTVTKEELNTFLTTDEKGKDPAYNSEALLTAIAGDDGVIDETEFNASLGASLQTLQFVVETDTNYDGAISTAELTAAGKPPETPPTT
jgi:Ca2+-binding EF-hand superfamily protein